MVVINKTNLIEDVYFDIQECNTNIKDSFRCQNI
nr:hypothetical protein [Francisella persica]